jgi:hypothetical protein
MLTESASAGAVVMAVSSESIQTGKMDIFEMAAPSSKKKKKAGGGLTALRPTSSPRAAVPLTTRSRQREPLYINIVLDATKKYPDVPCAGFGSRRGLGEREPAELG